MILMVPAVSGFGVVYHNNPLEGKMVGDLVRRRNSRVKAVFAYQQQLQAQRQDGQREQHRQDEKPGEGGQLPGHKVYPWIARTRQ